MPALGLMRHSSDDVVVGDDCDTALDIVADCINHSDQLVRVINDRLMPGNLSTGTRYIDARKSSTGTVEPTDRDPMLI